MYIPPDFREERLDVLHQAIRSTRLATLVTLGSDGLEASHVPMLLDAGDGPYGALRFHLARANAQYRRLVDGGVPALAMFLGPDAYISPNWYETKRETGKVVPTWNYVTVHAYGPLEPVDDEGLRAIVEGLTRQHEADQPKPWAVSDAPEDYIAGMLRAIVGFRLPIARLEGKWKMNQNRTVADRAGVVAGLGAGDARQAEVARLVGATVDPGGSAS